MSIFKNSSEAQITNAIIDEFTREFKEYTVSDVIIVGGGPSGLMAGRELARNKVKTLVVESNNYLGGGFWIGGYLMNKLTVREPAQTILDELAIPYKEYQEGLYVTDGPTACSKLIAAACDAGVKIINMTKADDVIHKSGRVKGVVINWTAVGALPRALTCVDPVSLESKLVVDATGHDASVARALERRGFLAVKGYGAMDVESSEELVVKKTGEVYPGLLACGMSVSTIFGIPRMGPTFGAMLLSGKKAAEVALNILLQDAVRI